MRLLVFAFFLVLSVAPVWAQETPTAGDSTHLEPIKTKKPVYPLEASMEGIQGEVVLQVTVSEAGDVEKVDVVSGDPILAKAAVDAYKKWKFKPFIKNGKAIKVSTRLPVDFYFSGKEIKHNVSADNTATLGSSSAKGSPAQPASSAPAGTSASADASDATKPIRLEPGVSRGMLIHSIAPAYPWSARQNHVQGTVLLHAVIGKDGRIKSLEPLSGPQELIPAAVGAVQQWRYKPYLLMGEPVQVETIITVNFRLSP